MNAEMCPKGKKFFLSPESCYSGCPGCTGEPWNREAEKQERIRAAAPELLEACKKMLEAWDCRTPEAGIVAIEKAIAKAEGRQI